MSIFGEFDSTVIGDDPFETADNTYWAVCTESFEEEKNGDVRHVIKWTIDEPDSEYHSNTVREQYGLNALMDIKAGNRTWNDLDGNEKKALKFYKRRLRRGFDLSEEEIQKIKYDDFIGKGAYITTITNEGKGDRVGQKFTNVRDAVCKRVFDEERGQDTTSKSLGL